MAKINNELVLPSVGEIARIVSEVPAKVKVAYAESPNEPFWCLVLEVKNSDAVEFACQRAAGDSVFIVNPCNILQVYVNNMFEDEVKLCVKYSSHPISIIVENKTDDSKYDVELFNAHKYLNEDNKSKWEDGSLVIDGVEIRSGFGNNVPYNLILRMCDGADEHRVLDVVKTTVITWEPHMKLVKEIRLSLVAFDEAAGIDLKRSNDFNQNHADSMFYSFFPYEIIGAIGLVVSEIPPHTILYFDFYHKAKVDTETLIRVDPVDKKEAE